MKKLFKNADPNQRRAANNIFIFLVAMLIFTLIARGTSGATLARVTVVSPVRSEIIESLNATATVVSSDIIEISAIEDLTILEMFVGAGQEIEKDTAIAEFCMEELTEKLLRENSRLEQMRLDLEKLERIDPIDTTSIDNARRTLARANEDYNAVVESGEKEINEARENLELLLLHWEHEAELEEHEISTALRNYARALEDFLATEEQGRKEIQEAQDELLKLEQPDESEDNALQTAIRNYNRALEDYNAVVEENEESVQEAQEALDDARKNNTADRTALDNAQRTYDRAKEDYDSAKERGEENIENLWQNLRRASNALNAALAQDPPDEDIIAEARAEVERAQNAYDTAEAALEDSLLPLERRLEDAEVALKQAQESFDEKQETQTEQLETALETAKTRAADNIQTAARRLEDAEIALELAYKNFETNLENETERLKTALETAETRAADNLATATRRLEDASVSVSTEIENAQKALQSAIDRANDNNQSSRRRVEDAQISLASAEASYQRTIQQHADTVAQNRINAVTMELDLIAQEKIVNELNQLIEANGILYAKETGVITSALSRSDIVAKTPIITLRDNDGKFEAQVQIPVSDAEVLSVGGECTVTTSGGNMFFTPTTTGIISSISSPDDNDRVTVTIALPDGNWSSGQRVETEVILTRGNYDMSIPVSALRSDNYGYFVYVVNERNTVLGLQNVVERVNIMSVLASDNEMVSVTGSIGRTDQIISESNRAVDVGDRVRVE